MAEDFHFEIQGLDELDAKLKALGEKARPATREALSQGGDAMRDAMRVSTAAAFTGEPAQVAAQQNSWSKSIKMQSDTSGTVSIKPKGSLPPLHVSRGKGIQPLGRIYRRSLRYLIALCEFGASGGKERGALGRKTPMSGGFESYKDAILERVIDVLKEELGVEE